VDRKTGKPRPYANVNDLVQSSARELLEHAWKRFADEFGRGDLVWFPIHDELVLHVPDPLVGQVMAEVEQCMRFDFMGVPIKRLCRAATRAGRQLPLDDQPTCGNAREVARHWVIAGTTGFGGVRTGMGTSPFECAARTSGCEYCTCWCGSRFMARSRPGWSWTTPAATAGAPTPTHLRIANYKAAALTKVPGEELQRAVRLERRQVSVSAGVGMQRLLS
jgi:hypothetical protein